MYKRIVPLLAIGLLMSLMLVACGEANIPTYTGGTAVSLNDSVKSAFTTSNVKNSKIEAFKTSDSVDKVKSGFTDSFSKDGWSNKVSEVDTLTKTLEPLKGFALAYEKNGKAAVVMGFPGSAAPALGIEGVGASDTVYMILSGEK